MKEYPNMNNSFKNRVYAEESEAQSIQLGFWNWFFFVSQKVQPHTYLEARGNFITSLRPQRVAVVELDSGNASQAHDDAKPVRHPEVPDGLVHVLDQNRHAHYNQLNFVKRWIFLNQYHVSFIQPRKATHSLFVIMLTNFQPKTVKFW